MRKTFVCLTLSVIFCLLAVVLPTPYAARTAAAAAAPQQPDPCVKCNAKVQQRLEKCEARSGGPTQQCYDEYNQGVVDCYATVCEQ